MKAETAVMVAEGMAEDLVEVGSVAVAAEAEARVGEEMAVAARAEGGKAAVEKVEEVKTVDHAV